MIYKYIHTYIYIYIFLLFIYISRCPTALIQQPTFLNELKRVKPTILVRQCVCCATSFCEVCNS